MLILLDWRAGVKGEKSGRGKERREKELWRNEESVQERRRSEERREQKEEEERLLKDETRIENKRKKE